MNDNIHEVTKYHHEFIVWNKKSKRNEILSKDVAVFYDYENRKPIINMMYSDVNCQVIDFGEEDFYDIYEVISKA